LKENFDRFQFEIYKEKVMADFRKCVFAFAALALLLGAASTANAQSAFQCIANAGVPPLARSEGITELVGDVVLNCTGGTALTGVTAGLPIPVGGEGAADDTIVPTVNIRIFLNTAVTSRLLSDPWSEAMLMIGEPTSGFVGCVNGATVTSNGTLCNVYQGRVVGGNSVEFLGVPVLPPGSTGTTIYRVTNVRANASAVAPGGSGTPGQIVALISATPATFGFVPGGPAQISPSFPINNPQQIVGFVQAGLTFSMRNAANSESFSTSFGFQQCVSRTGRGDSGFAILRYTEGFPTAFKVRTVQQTATLPDFNSPLPVTPQNVPGFIYNTESGYYNPSFAGSIPALANSGLADFSTRVRAIFTNVPAGVRLFVTVRETATSTGNNRARLVGSEIGAFFPVTALTDTYGDIGTETALSAAEVPIVSGTGTAVWELMTVDPLSTGALDFGLFAIYTADVANNVPAAPSQATVSGSFAPITGPTSASATAPIPRFVDLGTARNLFRINICVTNLLFPFVTNSAGFDTGLAISNTSQDPFGTATQTGTCTLNWYGSGAPAASATPSVAAGTTWVNTVMNLAPNFQGYMIAQCRFQYAHGFAFISDIGARNLAMGYLALIIPDPARDPDPFPAAGVGSGEQLGY
jgi:hypothetical protein